MLVRLIVSTALVVIVTNCGVSGAPTSASTGSPSTMAMPTAAVAGMIARPLHLPRSQPGSPCPITPVATASTPVTSPRGHGPFYLGGPAPQGTYPWNKTVYAIVGAGLGPIVLRGASLNGAGQLEFSGTPADQGERGETVASASGATETFYKEVVYWSSTGAFFLYPSTSGCYAIQVDGQSFEDVIVIQAS